MILKILIAMIINNRRRKGQNNSQNLSREFELSFISNVSLSFLSNCLIDIAQYTYG